MELRYRKETLVGLLLVAGAVAFVGLLMWMQGKSFRQGDVIHASFESVAGLKEGDPVRTSGVRVGNVKSIILVTPGNVDVTFDVQHGPPPREDAQAQIVAADLFGARFIEYTPGTSSRPLPPNRVVHGARMEDISGMATSLSGQGKDVMTEAILVSHQLRLTLENANRLLTTLNGSSATAMDTMIASLGELRRALQRMDQLVAQTSPAAEQTMRNAQAATAHADTLMRSLSRTSAAMDSLLELASHGRGPVPRLLGDSTVMNELMATNTALRELLIDFKANPGKYIRFRL
jgi:phospholipid/cholesterol/gamma-HCH transport system substrate-binding protein